MKNKATLTHTSDGLYEGTFDNWVEVVFKPDRTVKDTYVIAGRAMVWKDEILVYEKENPNNNQKYGSWTVIKWSQWVSFYKNMNLKKEVTYAAILNTKDEEVATEQADELF